MTPGLTRIFAKLVTAGLLQTGPKSPADVLVVIPSDQRRPQAQAAAAQLRKRGRSAGRSGRLAGRVLSCADRQPSDAGQMPRGVACICHQFPAAAADRR